MIVWDVRQAAAAETLAGHASGIESLRVTRDGRTLYSAGLDGTVVIWDLVGRRRLGRPFKASAGGDAFASAVSADGLFARGQEDGAITITDTRTLAPKTPFRVIDTGEGLRVRFVPGSRLMIVGGEAGFLALVGRRFGAGRQAIAWPSRRHLHAGDQRRWPPPRHGQRRQHGPVLVAPRRPGTRGAAPFPQGPLGHPAESRRPLGDRVAPRREFRERVRGGLGRSHPPPGAPRARHPLGRLRAIQPGREPGGGRQSVRSVPRCGRRRIGSR